MMSREQKILSCIDPKTQIGIEIGALNRPIVTRDMGTIRYIDHASTEELRSKYANDPNVDISRIVDVDYVWGCQTLPELVGNEAPFDYVIASHVIEHVPDFIGWLKEVRSILKPGGVLSLVIPDKRRCFDYCRNTTKPADVLEPYLRRSRKPYPRQIFDHFSSAVAWNGAIAWSEQCEESALHHIHPIAQAWDITKQTFEADTYCDVHCWVFTPYSLYELLKVLIQLNLFDFKIEQFHSTEGCEFFVSLRAGENTATPEAQARQIESLSLLLTEPDAIETDRALATGEVQIKKLKTESEQLHLELQNLKEKLKHSRQQLKQCRTTRKALQAEINTMKASKFWKLQIWWSKLRSGQI